MNNEPACRQAGNDDNEQQGILAGARMIILNDEN
jgi:hypothetical protein